MTDPPSPFAPLLGQPQAITLLTRAVTLDRVAPAYLFTGANGVGRGLAAQCFAASLFCAAPGVNPLMVQSRIHQRNHPDLLWVEPTYLHQGKRLSPAEAMAAGVKRKTPPLIRLEQIREVAQFLSRSPLEAPRSLVVIEQAEAMAEAPANALLKTLEEPGQATIILLAPGVEALLPTLVSRCQRIPFYRLPTATMAQVLEQLGRVDLLQQPQVLALAQGSPGEAIAHGQQFQDIPPDFLQAVSQRPRNPQQALALARQIDQALEPEMQRWLIDYLQQCYWQQEQLTLQHAALAVSPLQRLEKARQYLLQNVQPRLVWEVTLLEMVSH